MNINQVLIEACKDNHPGAAYEAFGNGIRQTLKSLWDNSRGFKGGASKEDIFLNAAAMAGYSNAEADGFLVAEQITKTLSKDPGSLSARQEAFKNDVRKAVRETIANLDGGTVGIGKDCLWQMAVGRIARSMNAPQGINAPFFAREAFDSVVSEAQFRNFVY